MARISNSISLEELERRERAGELGYRTPDNQTLLDLASSRLQNPSLSISPNRQWAALFGNPKYTPFAQLTAEEVSVAGLRIHCHNFNKSRGRSYYDSAHLLHLGQIQQVLDDPALTRDAKEARILAEAALQPLAGLPESPLLRSIQWAPNSASLSFLLTEPDDVQLWVADVASATARKLAGGINCSVAINSYVWKPNSSGLIALHAAHKGEPVPKEPMPPFSPSIHSNVGGRQATARTYQNLLKTPYDCALFQFFGTSRVVQIGLETGESVDFPATEGLVQSLSVSPDGKYLFVKTLHEPFSYLVPYSRFPHSNRVWALAQPTATAPLFQQELPLQEEVPSRHDATRVGPRYVSWVPSAPSSLFWVEALDGGDPQIEAEFRDSIRTLAAPFQEAPGELLKVRSRFAEADWSEEGFAWVEEREWKTRWSRVHKVVLEPTDVTQVTPVSSSLVFDRSYEDAYASPGSVLINKNAAGRFVVAGTGQTVLLESPGATPAGYRPFLRRFDTESLEATEIWRCGEEVYERVSTILRSDGSSFITRRQSNNVQPNLRLYWTDKTTGVLDNVQLTAFPHPYPWLDEVRQELVTYSRADGVQLSGKLLLPAGFEEGKDAPLPMLVWAYPREFTSKAAANQVKVSSTTFTAISASSPAYWVTQGYAVLMSASMPIVSVASGSMENANDGFIEQLVANAETHVGEMVARKVADPLRVAVGGHSYGAFMTAHLLVHTKLFCAGVARSGTYNRTLTPFGFQSEDRTLWESGDLYYKLSPFNHVKDITAPLLLFHGERDCNSGTYTDQSIRFYNALKGNGKVARLVVLPYEDHSYKAKENILHLIWETDYWLHNFVKNRQLPLDKQEDSPAE